MSDSKVTPEQQVGRLARQVRYLRNLVWLLIALVILSGATGFGAARYYAKTTCTSTSKVLTLQRTANEKTEAFLKLAAQRARQAAAHDTGARKAADLAAAAKEKDLADSYGNVDVTAC